MCRHAARKQLIVSPHVSLTDCRGLGESLPPLCGIGPIARATGKQGHDDDAQVCYRLPPSRPGMLCLPVEDRLMVGAELTWSGTLCTLVRDQVVFLASVCETSNKGQVVSDWIEIQK